MIRHRRWHGSGRKAAITVGAIVGAVVVLALIAALVVSLILPRVVRGVATRAITEVPGYSGRVGAVDFSLRTGAMSMRDVVIDVEKDGGGAQRLATIPRMDVEIDSDGPLVERRFAYKAILRGPVVTVRGAAREELGEEAEAAAKGDSPVVGYLQGVKQNLDKAFGRFPVRTRLARMEIRDGTFSLPDLAGRDALDFRVVALHATVQPREGNGDALDVEASGRSIADSRFALAMVIDTGARTPAFDGRLRLRGLDLPKANPILGEVTDVDLSKGKLDFGLDFRAKDGRFSGTAHPVATGVAVRGPEDEKEDEGLLETLKEWIVGGAKEVAETSDGRIDRRIPFSGRLPEEARDPWSGLREVLSEGMVTGLKVGGEQG